MSDQLMIVWMMVGFGFLLVAGAWLGAGSHTALVGLFAARGVRDWLTGIQEADAPHFAVAHLDSLRPAEATPTETTPAEATPAEATPTETTQTISRRLPDTLDDLGGPPPEVVDLGVRRLDR